MNAMSAACAQQLTNERALRPRGDMKAHGDAARDVTRAACTLAPAAPPEGKH